MRVLKKCMLIGVAVVVMSTVWLSVSGESLAGPGHPTVTRAYFAPYDSGLWK
ncbi:hypothetical protein NSQ26_09700 [Bacillus sp. FSL W7-1360]